jgi:hypothetical protein
MEEVIAKPLFVSPIAQPMATDKLAKKLLSITKKRKKPFNNSHKR